MLRPATRRLLALTTLFCVGCQSFRMESAVSSRAAVLDTRVEVASREELAEVNSLLMTCYDRLVGISRASHRTHNSHKKPGLMTSLVASMVLGASFAASSRNDPFPSNTQRIAVGVFVAALGLTAVDLTFHPSVRAARERNERASNEWLTLRRALAQWDEASRSWSSATSAGNTLSADAAMTRWRTEHGQLRTLAADCAARESGVTSKSAAVAIEGRPSPS